MRRVIAGLTAFVTVVVAPGAASQSSVDSITTTGQAGIEIAVGRAYDESGFPARSAAETKRSLFVVQSQGPRATHRPVSDSIQIDASPGDYVIRVGATLPNGDVTSAVQISFRVLAPLWARWWFQLLFGTAVVGLTWGTRTRLSRMAVQRQREIQAARDKERAAVQRQAARDFHDEIGNEATRIMHLGRMAAKATDAELSELLDEIVNGSRRLSHGVSDFIWTLDADSSTLADVLVRLSDYGDRLFYSTATSFRSAGRWSDLEEYVLDAESRANVLLIGKEALNNAYKHSGAKGVNLAVRRESANHIVIVVEDDGPGFDTNDQATGFGLESMRHRAATLGGGLDISNPGSGTRVELRLAPLTRSHRDAVRSNG